MKAKLPNFGNNSMSSMLKQAQKMQAQMSQIQQELSNEEFTGTAGGGAVTVTITGSKIVKSVNLAPEVVCPEEIEMLQDLIVAAFNQAIETSEAESNKRIGAVTGGLSIPGLI